ncbi:GDP-mannose 4,6-dehydratase [Halomonas sp. KAO]|uniref:GDP-mannose 4,6-dehydratase n=1 Tax=Halomonas sp. KAO TaxID=2783858 RepID=UPI0018A1165C|nr:GDP-mannose 4,6-dehydratase [Halomonas sp. KAO]MBF7052523.1 GDP-mannose 4,6-dehydratase [Halomonas sp. KAO]
MRFPWLASLEATGVHIYNLGTGQGVSVREMVTTFERVTGQRVPYHIAPRREGDLAAFWADAAKAERELGWRAERGLEAMLRDTWHWQERNPQGYGAV